jgi:RNA polymerase sigma-70 factor (ECF subfamily)
MPCSARAATRNGPLGASPQSADAVANQAILFGRGAPASDTTEAVLVNGAPGELRRRDGRPFSLLAFTIAGDRIVGMDIIADAERLGRLGIA